MCVSGSCTRPVFSLNIMMYCLYSVGAANMAMVKSGWLHRQSEQSFLKKNDHENKHSITHVVHMYFLFFPPQVPSCAAGKETGLTCGLTVVWCSTGTSRGGIWRMTSTWESTASTSAALQRVTVRDTAKHSHPACKPCFKALSLHAVLLSELTPPEGKTRDALFQIVCRDGRVISLCADGADDAL